MRGEARFAGSVAWVAGGCIVLACRWKTAESIWTIDDRSVATVSTSFAVGAAIVNGISPGMTTVYASVGRTMPVVGSGPVTITQP